MDIKVLVWIAAGLLTASLIFLAWLRAHDARLRAQAEADGRARGIRDMAKNGQGADTAILDDCERRVKEAQDRAETLAAELKRLGPAAWLNNKGRPRQ